MEKETRGKGNQGMENVSGRKRMEIRQESDGNGRKSKKKD